MVRPVEPKREGEHLGLERLGESVGIGSKDPPKLERQKALVLGEVVELVGWS